MLDDKEVIALLRSEVDRAGGQSSWARQERIDRTLLNRVLSGHRPPTDQIIRALGFAPSFRYEKFRTEWTDGEGHVVLDETPIGNYGEIEGPPDWIDATAARLEISHQQYITASYSELFLDWKRRSKSPADDMTFAAIPAR